MGKSEQLLQKLKKPMSYIGEERTHYAYLGGSWVDLKEVISRQWNPDRALPLLKERLYEIMQCLEDECVADPLADDLYKEAQGIRWAMSVMTAGGKSRDPLDERKDDARRWIDYSRKIS